MKVKEVTLHKEFKRGLPNYSNITVGAHVTYSIGDDEQFVWDEAWDELNQQLSIQSDTTDPSWISSQDTKHYHKTVIKTPKTPHTNL